MLGVREGGGSTISPTQPHQCLTQSPVSTRSEGSCAGRVAPGPRMRSLLAAAAVSRPALEELSSKVPSRNSDRWTSLNPWSRSKCLLPEQCTFGSEAVTQGCSGLQRTCWLKPFYLASSVHVLLLSKSRSTDHGLFEPVCVQGR